VQEAVTAFFGKAEAWRAEVQVSVSFFLVDSPPRCSSATPSPLLALIANSSYAEVLRLKENTSSSGLTLASVQEAVTTFVGKADAVGAEVQVGSSLLSAVPLSH
jgi:hypothetical protein